MRVYRYVYLGIYTSFGSPCILGSPRCTHAMLMHFDVAGIDHDPLQVRAISEVCSQVFPKACFCKPSESHKNAVPIPIIWREISPRRPRAHNPYDSVEKASVVSGRATTLPRAIGEKRCNLVPKFISDIMSVVSFDGIHAEGSLVDLYGYNIKITPYGKVEVRLAGFRFCQHDLDGTTSSASRRAKTAGALSTGANETAILAQSLCAYATQTKTPAESPSGALQEKKLVRNCLVQRSGRYPEPASCQSAARLKRLATFEAQRSHSPWCSRCHRCSSSETCSRREMA